ncbi:MAG: winged helix-turn-helix domain-containing protein [Dehalococcoidia bacterium]
MTRTDVPNFKVGKPSRFSRRSQPGYAVNGKIWLEKDGELYLGWGRVILLERIDEYGSIAAAARSMKLGYRNAWLWVESMNRLAPAPVVEKVTGGAGGGYTRVTEEGKRAIARYKELHSRFHDSLKQEQTA